MPAPGQETTRRPLISNTSTLIFSGFLVAVALTDFASGEWGRLVLACGLVGLLGYVGLEVAAERRRRAATAAENEAFRRLNKHLTTPMAPPIALDFDGDPLAEFLAAEAEGSGRARTTGKPETPQAG